MSEQPQKPKPQVLTPAESASPPPLPPDKKIVCIAIGAPAVFGLIYAYFTIQSLNQYGWSLFLVLPILISFFSSLIFARYHKGAKWFASYKVANLSIVATGILILFLAVEGFICLLMAMPLAVGLSYIGTSLGHSCSKISRKSGNVISLILPLFYGFLVSFEHSHPPTLATHQVTTKVEIHAPIEEVWDQVIAFDEIKDPATGIFRFGIAYPMRARIVGHGVGAVRHCIFSTGPFVEPITRWDAPHALEFTVASNPPPMHELSPWGHIETPHLDHAFQSKRGQFHLSEKNGITTLEGTTWYQQHILPDFYWHHISDTLIHKIHLRVFKHIKERAEQSPPTPR